MLKTVEIQQSIAQLQAMEKIQQVQQQHADLQQRHFALQFGEERKRLKEKVKDADETEFHRLPGRQEGQSSRRGRDPEKQPVSAAAPVGDYEKKSADDDGTHIDIKV